VCRKAPHVGNRLEPELLEQTDERIGGRVKCPIVQRVETLSYLTTGGVSKL
jgi:hypothetical protein